MVWKAISAAFGIALIVFGIPGMIDDWAVWQRWLADWRWHNVFMVVGGLVAILYGSRSFVGQLSSGLTGIRSENLRSVLDYRVDDDTTVKQVLLWILLFPFGVVFGIVAIGLMFVSMGGLFRLGVWLLGRILDFIGVSSPLLGG